VKAGATLVESNEISMNWTIYELYDPACAPWRDELSKRCSSCGGILCDDPDCDLPDGLEVWTWVMSCWGEHLSLDIDVVTLVELTVSFVVDWEERGVSSPDMFERASKWIG
jgi:hypothetical protein